MKKFKILDGNIVESNEECRSCFLIKNKVSEYLNPIYENPKIIVSQDMEYPIPAFYIVSTKKHISNLYEMDNELRNEISNTIYLIRKALKECLGIERVTIIHEEKDNSAHFHIWILPIWKNIKEKINPRIIKNNIEYYMNFFDFENNKEKIMECNNKMRNFLNLYTY